MGGETDASARPDADPRLIPALGGLRGMAALTVVFSHAERFDLIPRFMGVGAGHMGVMLFFTLSAFLLTHLYLDHPANGRNVRTFFVARFARVYPLFFVLLTLGFLAHLAGVPPADFPYSTGFRTWLQNVLLLGRFHVFWTICTEFQFYGLFALMWFAGWRLGNVRRFALACAACATLLVFADVHAFPSGPVYKTLHFFAAGILAALLSDTLARRRVRVGWADPLLLAALILFFLSLPDVFVRFSGFEHNGFWSPWLLLLAFLVIFSASLADGPASRALGSRVGRFLGDISFGIYLLHYPVLHYTARFIAGAPPPLAFAIALVLTILLACAAHVLFERPARLAINQRFSPGLDGQRRPAPAAA